MAKKFEYKSYMDEKKKECLNIIQKNCDSQVI